MCTAAPPPAQPAVPWTMNVLTQGWLRNTYFQCLKDTCKSSPTTSLLLLPFNPFLLPSCCSPQLLQELQSSRDVQVQKFPSSDLSCRQVVSSCKSSSAILSYPKIWQSVQAQNSQGILMVQESVLSHGLYVYLLNFSK